MEGVTMPRGPERQWRARKQPLTDELIHASVNGGLVDRERGFYATRVYVGVETEERAVELKRSLYRCAKRLGFSVLVQVEKVPATGEYQLRYHAIDKAKARAWMLATYGPDRSKWPYNPRRRNS